MEVTILVESNLNTYFANEQLQQQLLDYIQQKLPIYVSQHSAKIKPVRGQLAHLFELKVRLGRDFYRLAYFYDHDQLQAAYLSPTLQKVRFDREANHHLAQVQ